MIEERRRRDDAVAAITREGRRDAVQKIDALILDFADSFLVGDFLEMMEEMEERAIAARATHERRHAGGV